MSELRERAGLLLLLGVVAVAAGASRLAPFDPDVPLDPEAGALLPPGTVRIVVPRTDGAPLLAERVVERPGGLLVERRGRWQALFRPPGAPRPATHRFLLGTDRFGRDVESRLLYGARVSLAVGFAAALLSLTLGVAVGASAALGGALLDGLLMRAVDALLAFPRLFLLLGLGVLLEPGVAGVVLLLGGTAWMSAARVVRAEVLSLRRRPWALAARATGLSPGRLFFRHLLPNVATPLVSDFTLRVGDVLLVEAALSFLGAGIAPPTPTWGGMVAEAADLLPVAWWLPLFPGLAIAATVVILSSAADALRERLDPLCRSAGESRRGL